jgi:hypothetical protein
VTLKSSIASRIDDFTSGWLGELGVLAVKKPLHCGFRLDPLPGEIAIVELLKPTTTIMPFRHEVHAATALALPAPISQHEVMNPPAIDPRVRIGHVHLKVADLERSIRFYRDVLGFEVMQRFGDTAAFLSAGGYHHHIGLNTWESLGGSPPPPGRTGLYHTAILYPGRPSLANVL